MVWIICLIQPYLIFTSLLCSGSLQGYTISRKKTHRYILQSMPEDNASQESIMQAASVGCRLYGHHWCVCQIGIVVYGIAMFSHVRIYIGRPLTTISNDQ